VEFIFPMFAFSHGVEVYDITTEDRAVQTIYFRYSTGEPMSFSKIKIYPPSTADRNIESLISITDRNGLFSFVPDEEGVWRIDVEDGMGHAGSINITSNVLEKSIGVPSSRLPLAFTSVLGLSLILNIFAIWYFIAKRKKADGYAHQ
jgi:nickel transport protein